jgi:hypothetical protein
MLGWIVAAWKFLPVFVRAIVVGLIVFEIGSDGSAAAMFGNLKFHPEVPWAFPVVLLFCGIFWAYFSGWGFPAQIDKHVQSARAKVGFPLSFGSLRFQPWRLEL